MGKIGNQREVMTSAFLLLLGLLVLSLYFNIPIYSYMGPPQKLPHNQSFILSEESPSYVYDLIHADFGISSLQTNDTPVSVVLWHQNQVVFNATSIQQISDYDIEIPISGPYIWQLEIVRQDADVSVNLTTYHWATPIVFGSRFSPLVFGFIGLGLSVFALYLMSKAYRGTTSEEKGIRFLAIVVLLLLGTLSCYPLTEGVLAGDYTFRNTLASHPVGTYQYTLNSTHPNASLNLSSVYPGGGLSVSFKIHSINSSDYPLQLSVITDNSYNLTLEEESNNDDWWISIPYDANSTSFVRFERIDTDLDVEFSLETQFRIVAQRQDITIPAIFGILGISAIFGGLVIAYRLDRSYD